MAHSVAELQAENVAYELECIDRMYLNCYVPKLSNAAGVAGFIRFHKERRFASTKDVAEMGKAFVRSIFSFAKQHQIPIHRFAKGERKDDVTQRFLKDFKGEEGVLYIGIAQEKASVPRTIRKRFPDGGSIPWIEMSTALVNHYYFYCVDKDYCLPERPVPGPSIHFQRYPGHRHPGRRHPSTWKTAPPPHSSKRNAALATTGRSSWRPASSSMQIKTPSSAASRTTASSICGSPGSSNNTAGT